MNKARNQLAEEGKQRAKAKAKAKGNETCSSYH